MSRLQKTLLFWCHSNFSILHWNLLFNVTLSNTYSDKSTRNVLKPVDVYDLSWVLQKHNRENFLFHFYQTHEERFVRSKLKNEFDIDIVITSKTVSKSFVWYVVVAHTQSFFVHSLKIKQRYFPNKVPTVLTEAHVQCSELFTDLQVFAISFWPAKSLGHAPRPQINNSSDNHDLINVQSIITQSNDDITKTCPIHTHQNAKTCISLRTRP